MAYYDALIAKWATLAPGTTAQKLAAINAITVTGPAQPSVVPTFKIYNSVDPTEFVALTAAAQQRCRDIFGMGTVDVSPGTNVRNVLLSLFGPGTATRTALSAMAATYEAPQVPWWSASVSIGGGGLNSPVSASDLVAAGGLS